MSADETANEVPGGAESPRRSAAAAAASRARRIGGRVPGGTTTKAGAAPGTDTTPGSGTTPGTGTTVGNGAAARPPAAIAVPEPAAAAPGTVPTWPAAPGRQPVAVIAVPAWLRWAPAGVLSAGAIAMAVLLLVFSHGVWWGTTSASVQREEVLAAAKTCVATTQTYKYTDLDNYERKALACAAGTFRAQFKRTIENVVKKHAPSLKAVQRARIDRGGIESITKDGRQWTILVFGELAVTNTNYPAGQTDPFGAQARMEKVDGQWRLVGLQTVSTPV
jgi:hypothetical protein